MGGINVGIHQDSIAREERYVRVKVDGVESSEQMC
jgi:hypothetical protein